MQHRTSEPRQARKGAAATRIHVCRRVPGHFCLICPAYGRVSIPGNSTSLEAKTI